MDHPAVAGDRQAVPLADAGAARRVARMAAAAVIGDHITRVTVRAVATFLTTPLNQPMVRYTPTPFTRNQHTMLRHLLKMLQHLLRMPTRLRTSR